MKKLSAKAVSIAWAGIIMIILFLAFTNHCQGQIQMNCDSCWCEGTIHFYDPYTGHKPIATNIFDDSYSASTLDNTDDHRAQIFTAYANFTVSRVRLPLIRVGYLVAQDLVVEVREVGGGDNPIGPVISYGVKPFSDIFLDTVAAWYPIKMSRGEIISGKQYAIILHLDFADSENKVLWNSNYKGYPGGFAIWTNNGYQETGEWQKNSNVDRLFEIWGKEL